MGEPISVKSGPYYNLPQRFHFSFIEFLTAADILISSMPNSNLSYVVGFDKIFLEKKNIEESLAIFGNNGQLLVQLIRH